jgi:predicted small secreted protein
MKKATLMIHAMIISFVACAFLLAGCESTMVSETQDELLTGNSITEMSSVKTIKMVPYKGIISGSGSLDLSREDCPPGTLPISGTGTGVASHVGKVDIYFSHCSYFLVDPTNFTYVDGYGITTAANGDQIFGTYSGSLTGPDSYMDVVTITGGTGRFENISGSFTEYGKVAFTSETSFDYEMTLEGMISSVGSGK